MNNYVVGVLVALLLVPAMALAAVNINTADATLLDTLPGIGPSKAAAIIDYRTTHGPFARPQDLQEVKGIGPSTYASLEALITVTGGESTAPPKPAPKVQPKAAAVSSNTQQSVEAAQVTQTPHAEDAVIAPGAATGLAAAGALVDEGGAGGGLFSSPWTLGFLALLVLAGGALMIL